MFAGTRVHEEDSLCCPFSGTSHLLLETRLLTDLVLQASWPENPRNLLISSSSVVGLQVGVILGFLQGILESNSLFALRCYLCCGGREASD